MTEQHYFDAADTALETGLPRLFTVDDTQIVAVPDVFFVEMMAGRIPWEQNTWGVERDDGRLVMFYRLPDNLTDLVTDHLNHPTATP